MRILVTGGTGLLGSHLVPHLSETAKVVVNTRNVAMAELQLTAKIALTSQLKSYPDLDEFDAVINLAGEPIVAKRWSQKQKQVIRQSRWDLTDLLVEKIRAGKKPPRAFLSASAIGYYGRQDDTIIDESFASPHDEFSHQICKIWEEKALAAQSDKTRVCILRTGIVLSHKGGALEKMLPLFRMGLGGPIGNGQQYMSWIHINDWLAATLHLLGSSESRGIYNLTAPNPVTNAVFSQALANRLGKPCSVRTPAFALRLLMGEMADLLLYGQRVVPQRLQQEGFAFRFPELDSALANLNLS